MACGGSLPSCSTVSVFALDAEHVWYCTPDELIKTRFTSAGNRGRARPSAGRGFRSSYFAKGHVARKCSVGGDYPQESAARAGGNSRRNQGF